jgi:glucosamine kinase
MILIADSGSSKTDWRLFHPFNSKVLSFTSRGLNPYFVNAREISETIEQTIPKVHIDQISTVYFYGSGCGTNDSKKTVYSGFKNVFDHIDINIYSDLSAACRALFGRTKTV